MGMLVINGSIGLGDNSQGRYLTIQGNGDTVLNGNILKGTSESIYLMSYLLRQLRVTR
jgi:hypothetical protein